MFSGYVPCGEPVAFEVQSVSATIQSVMSEVERTEARELATAQARYRLAGFVYLVVAMAVIGLTVTNPALASEERRADVAHLLVGLPFIGVFAALIAWGDRVFAVPARWVVGSVGRAASIGRWIREKVVLLLTLSALGRTAVFAANGFGVQPRLNVGVALEAIPPNPKMLINAVLMAILVVLLARASWVPFLKRWPSR